MPPMYLRAETVQNSHCSQNQNLIGTDLNSELFTCPERRPTALWQAVQRKSPKDVDHLCGEDRDHETAFVALPWPVKLLRFQNVLNVHAGNFVILRLHRRHPCKKIHAENVATQYAL